MPETAIAEEQQIAGAVPPAPERRKYLLTSGICKCGLCGEDLEGKPNRRSTLGYVCVKASDHHPSRKGCGRIYISAEPLNDYVAGKVLAWMALPFSVRRMQSLIKKSVRTGSALTDEIAAVREQMRELGEDRMKGLITKESFLAGNATGIERLRTLRTEVRRSQVQLDAVEPLTRAKQLADWWETTATMQEKHDLVSIVIEEIRIMPTVRRGFRGFQPERVEIVWQPGITWKN